MPQKPNSFNQKQQHEYIIAGLSLNAAFVSLQSAWANSFRRIPNLFNNHILLFAFSLSATSWISYALYSLLLFILVFNLDWSGVGGRGRQCAWCFILTKSVCWERAGCQFLFPLLCYAFSLPKLWRWRGGGRNPLASDSWDLGHVLDLDTNVGSFYGPSVVCFMCLPNTGRELASLSPSLSISYITMEAGCQRALGPQQLSPARSIKSPGSKRQQRNRKRKFILC